MANIGQVKNLFSINFAGYDWTLSYLPAWWLASFSLDSETDPTDIATRGDMSFLDCYHLGRNPFDFYDGVLPALSIVTGGNQRGLPGSILTVPLSVRVNTGNFNAPLTFTVTSGNALISATNDSSSAPSVSLDRRSTVTYTDPLGNQFSVAQVYIYLPNIIADASTIAITATSGNRTTCIQTTVVTADPTLAAPTGLTVTPTSPTTVLLSWTPDDSTQPTTIQASLNGGATWITVGAVMAGENSVTITAMTPDVEVTFRVITGNVSGKPPVTGTLPISGGVGPSPGGGTEPGAGGSVSSDSGTGKPLSVPVLYGRSSSWPGIKYGFPGLSDTNSRFLHVDHYSVRIRPFRECEFHGVGDTDPKTGEINVSEYSDSYTDYDRWFNYWEIESNTFEETWGDDPSSYEYAFYQISNEYTSAQFHANVQQWVGDPTGPYLEGGSEFAGIDNPPGDLNYTVTKHQYKFKVDAIPNSVVTWVVQYMFGPDVQSDVCTWTNTTGTTETPEYLIDPCNYQSPMPGHPTLNPSKRPGKYSVTLLPVDISITYGYGADRAAMDGEIDKLSGIISNATSGDFKTCVIKGKDTAGNEKLWTIQTSSNADSYLKALQSVPFVAYLGHASMGMGPALKASADAPSFDPNSVTAPTSGGFLGLSNSQAAISLYYAKHLYPNFQLPAALPSKAFNYPVPKASDLQLPDNGARYPNSDGVPTSGSFSLHGGGSGRYHMHRLSDNGNQVKFAVVGTNRMASLPNYGYKVLFDAQCFSGRDYSEVFQHGYFIAAKGSTKGSVLPIRKGRSYLLTPRRKYTKGSVLPIDTPTKGSTPTKDERVGPTY